MIHTLTKKQLRELIQDAEFACTQDEDGDLMLVLEADEDFPFDVTLWFNVTSEGENFNAIARCEELEVEDVLEFANEYNLNSTFLKAVSTDGESALGFDVSCNLNGLSEDYFVRNYIEGFIGEVWSAYCQLYNGDEEE